MSQSRKNKTRFTPGRSTMDEAVNALLHRSFEKEVNETNCSELSFQRPHFCFGESSDLQVKRTVCYIVAGLVFRGSPNTPQILLVQEAKEECRGRWYLPAGRLEAAETLEEGTQREVEEEAGYTVSVDELIYIETQGGGWLRFTFSCSVTGGKLKTAENGDKESLQAQWFPVGMVLDKKIDLRAKDVLNLVREGTKRYQQNNSVVSIKILPVHVGVPGMFIRILLIDKKASGVYALVANHSAEASDSLSLPIVQYGLNNFVPLVITQAYRELLVRGAGAAEIPCRCIGIHCFPKPKYEHDGMCLTLLCVMKPKMNTEVKHKERFVWSRITDDNMLTTLDSLETNGPYFKVL